LSAANRTAFNFDPATYIEGFGGIRQCDVIAVTSKGAKVLTPFQNRIDDLVLDGSYSSNHAA
jgi:Xaa-Pro aminopeptidase